MNTGIHLSAKPVARLMLNKVLLLCGILSSLMYIGMSILIPLQFPGYDSASQTISELSAIDAPTRKIWVAWGIVYTILVTAFGIGLLLSAGDNRKLRIVGILLIIYGIIGIGWPMAPMHQREVLAAGGGTLSDTLHIIFSMVTVFIMLLAMAFGAFAFGKGFRFYSLLTILVLLVLGIFTGMDAPKLEADLPTPWLGIVERILIGVFLVWIIVLATNVIQSVKNEDPLQAHHRVM